MAEIDYKPVFRELQKEVASILSESQYFKDRNITVLCEDSLEIEFEIKKALGQQGLVAVVNMLQASYLGHDGMVNAYQIDNLELDIVENPSVWRPYLKKKGIQDGTTTDIMQMAAEILGGPQSGIFGRFNPKSIEIGEDSDLVVGKAKFQTTVRQNVEGIIPEPGQPEIPFITRVDLKELLDEIDYLKNLIEGFSTEEIKQDIEDLKTADSELGARIDGLEDVYQPKGSYALTSDLEPYALKTQIPVNISQLNNDAGFLTQVSWDNVIQKPDVALASDIPTKTSQLVNDSITADSINALSRNGGKVVGRLMVGNEDEAHIEMSPGDYESAAHIQIGEAFSAGGHLELNGTDSWIRINGADVATEDELPKKTSDLVNDSKYISFGENTDQAGAVTIRAVGSTQYARISPGAFDIGSDPKPSAPLPGVGTSVYEGVINVTDQYDTGVVAVGSRVTVFSSPDEVFVQVDGNNLATESYVDEKVRPIPENISYFKNDVGYISAHQDLSDYATKAWVDEQGFLTAHQDLSDYATKNEIAAEAALRAAEDQELAASIQLKPNFQDIPVRTSQLDNDSGFITENDIPAVPTKTSDLINDSGFLTEHQSLEDYATKNYVDTQPVDADRIVNWPDFAYNSEVNTKFTEISDHVNSVEGAVQAIPENINKVYGQYKARYIDGDRQYFEMGEDGYVKAGTLALKSEMPANTSQLVNDSGYLTEVRYSDIIGKPVIPTKTSQLENDSGYVANVYWNDISDKPVIPARTSQLVNDSGFLNEVSWNDIQQKPSIPTRTSELINDSGFKTEVYWADLKEVPDLATQIELDASIRNTEQKLSLKLDKADYDDNEIFGQNRMRKIDGDGNVYSGTTEPGYYTPWTYSDGAAHDDPGIYGNDEDGWYLGIDQDTWASTRRFETQAAAQSFLDTALEIEYTHSEETMTATRQYVEPSETWTKTDELAYKSDIVESEGITEDECRSIVEGYGYQTSDDVESAITSKGYQTADDVSDAIDDRNYVTETQVESQITATGWGSRISQLETDTQLSKQGSWENFEATLEDGSVVSFDIFTRTV